MHEVLSQDLPCSSSDRNSQIIGHSTQRAKNGRQTPVSCDCCVNTLIRGSATQLHDWRTHRSHTCDEMSLIKMSVGCRVNCESTEEWAEFLPSRTKG